MLISLSFRINCIKSIFSLRKLWALSHLILLAFCNLCKSIVFIIIFLWIRGIHFLSICWQCLWLQTSTYQIHFSLCSSSILKSSEFTATRSRISWDRISTGIILKIRLQLFSICSSKATLTNLIQCLSTFYILIPELFLQRCYLGSCLTLSTCPLLTSFPFKMISALDYGLFALIWSIPKSSLLCIHFVSLLYILYHCLLKKFMLSNFLKRLLMS